MPLSCRGRVSWAPPLVFALAVGCQSYNFNPVDSCLVPVNRKTYTLLGVSTADVLFVVDDSGSMAAEQQRLADNFGAFINNLDQANAERSAMGLDPFDYHIAVTTTSVYYNLDNATAYSTTICSSTCPGASGLVCCVHVIDTDEWRPAHQAKACTPGVTACPSGTCGTNCKNLRGENYCCDQATGSTSAALTEVIPCSLEGATCGSLEKHFRFTYSDPPANTIPSCIPGVATDEYPYARGDYVAAGSNPRVLHFDKSLYPQPTALDPARTCSFTTDCQAGELCLLPSPTSTTKLCTKTLNRSCGTSPCASGESCVASINATGAPTFCRTQCGTCPSGFDCVSGSCQPTNGGGYTSQQLVDYFAGNVVVGTCGSVQEQGLSAAWMAIYKARAGQQPSGLHDSSKLVLVFVGDEDDCSSPEDPSGGVVMDRRVTGDDACVHDTTKRYDVASQFVSYFLGFKKPSELTAAFVEAAHENQCGYGNLPPCTTVLPLCCQDNCPSNGTCGQSLTDPYCGGQAFGTRFFAAADLLKAAGVNDVLKGSICDTDFRTLLDEIANLSRPPSGLELDEPPASEQIAVLRIIAADGKTTRHSCGPPAPAGLIYDQAIAQGYEWWFTESKGSGNPFTVSRYVYIVPSPDGACIANPGETYSAEYVPKLPAGGCASHTATGSLPAETGEEMCQRLLGGNEESWTCYLPAVGGACAATTYYTATDSGSGSCICGSRATNCSP